MEVDYEERRLSLGIVIEASALGSISLVVSFAFFIFNLRLRSNRWIKMSSPILNLFIACGGIFLSACCTLYGLDYFLADYSEAASAICQTRVGLLVCGSTLLFGPMFLKSWRVYRLFRNVGKKRLIIKDSRLLLMTAGLLLFDVLLLVIWRATDPLIFRPVLIYRQMEDTEPEDEYATTSVQTNNVTMRAISLTLTRLHSCTSAYFPFWLTAFVVLKIVLLCYGLFLSWQTRAVALPSMNDSQCIVVSALTTVAMTTLTVSVSYALEESRDAVYACLVVSIWVCTMVTLCMAFVPKVSLWRRNPEVRGMRVSVTSTCSSSPLFPLQQLEEELGQATAENDALRKSLEEKDVSIQKLQQHLTNAHKRLSSLGLSLDLIQDSGLDLDFSSSDSENIAECPDPCLLAKSRSKKPNKRYSSPSSSFSADSAFRGENSGSTETIKGMKYPVEYYSEESISSTLERIENGDCITSTNSCRASFPSQKDGASVSDHEVEMYTVSRERDKVILNKQESRPLSNSRAGRGAKKMSRSVSEDRSLPNSNSSGDLRVILLTDAAKMASLDQALSGNVTVEQEEMSVLASCNSSKFAGRRRSKQENFGSRRGSGQSETAFYTSSGRRQSSQSEAAFFTSSAQRRKSNQSEALYFPSTSRRQSAQSEAALFPASVCRRSSQSDNVFYPTSARRQSNQLEVIPLPSSTRRQSNQYESDILPSSAHGQSGQFESIILPSSNRRHSNQSETIFLPSYGRKSSLGCLSTRRGSLFTEKRPRKLSARRKSCMADPGKPASTHSDKTHKRKRRQSQRRHSANSFSSFDRISFLRTAIAQDLQHARSLSNILSNSVHKELDNINRRKYRQLSRRSSSTKSREDLAESIVGSYGLDDTSDTYSFVSSFLTVPSTVGDKETTVLNNDAFYPERCHKKNATTNDGPVQALKENGRQLTLSTKSSNNQSNICSDREIIFREPQSSVYGKDLAYHGKEPLHSAHVHFPDENFSVQNLTLKETSERACRSGCVQSNRSMLEAEEQQDIFSVQIAGDPQYVEAGFAQTRSLYSVDTFI